MKLCIIHIYHVYNLHKSIVKKSRELKTKTHAFFLMVVEG